MRETGEDMRGVEVGGERREEGCRGLAQEMSKTMEESI